MSNLRLSLNRKILSDVDGDAIHASLGLPPTLRVTEARIRNLELRVCFHSGQESLLS